MQREAKLDTKPITQNDEEGGEARYENTRPITRSHGTIRGGPPVMKNRLSRPQSHGVWGGTCPEAKANRTQAAKATAATFRDKCHHHHGAALRWPARVVLRSAPESRPQKVETVSDTQCQTLLHIHQIKSASNMQFLDSTEQK